MQFFVPMAADAAQAEQVWAGVRKGLAENGYPTITDRIRRVSFRHNSKDYVAEVGKRFPDLGEDVFIILRAAGNSLIYACTPHRGVLHSDPYLIGVDAMTAVEMFDE